MFGPPSERPKPGSEQGQADESTGEARRFPEAESVILPRPCTWQASQRCRIVEEQTGTRT